MSELLISGYNENDRWKILQGGYMTYTKIKEKESKGIRPFYRPNSFNREARIANKNSKKNNWFKSKSLNSNTQYTSVMFIDATPGDELLKLCKNIENNHRISDTDRIKFVSKTGIKLGSVVQKRDPFKENCSDEKCVPSKNGKDNNKVVNCKKSNIVYQAECLTCKSKGIKQIYYGETSRNLHIRSKEHYKDDDNKNKKSWMRKHKERYHKNNSNDCEFAWSVIKCFEKPMLRQLTEAVHIKTSKNDEIMNLKNEYCSNNIQGLELKKLTCRDCGSSHDSRDELQEHFQTIHERKKCTRCDYQSIGSTDLKAHMTLVH